MRNFTSLKLHQFGNQNFSHMKATQKKYFPSKNWPTRALGTISEILFSKENFVAGMRKNAFFFAPQGTNLNFRKNCILSACNPFNDDPVQKTIKLSRTKDTKKRRNVFFFFFLISFFVFFLFNVIFLTFFLSSNAQRFPQVFLHFSVFSSVSSF